MRRPARTIPLLSCAGTVALGLVVELMATGPVADKTGDVLYAVLMVLLVWTLRPATGLTWLAVLPFAWCVGVELLQLSGVPTAVAARVPAARLVLGSGFDSLDLAAYAVGVTVGVGVVAAVRRGTRDDAAAATRGRGRGHGRGRGTPSAEG